MGNYVFGKWSFDPQLNKLSDGEYVVVMEPLLTSLLVYLIEARGAAVSRDELIEKVWTGVVADAAVNQAIAKLRKHLNDDPKHPEFIQTVAKKGYMFVAAVTKKDIEEYAQPSDDNDLSQRATETPLVTATSHQKKFDFVHPKVLQIALSLLFLSGAAVIFYLSSAYQTQSNRLLTNVQFSPVTSLIGTELAPTINPLNSWLVFAHYQSDQLKPDLYLKTSPNSLAVNITNTNDVTEIRSAWSPDGKTLAYVSHSGKGCHINLLDFTNYPQSELPSAVQLTECSSFDIQIEWTRDGESILFNKHAYQGGPLRIYQFRISDSRIKELTSSPDGIVGDIAFDYDGQSEELTFVRTQHWNESEVWLQNGKSANKIIGLPYWIRGVERLPNSQKILISKSPDYKSLLLLDLENGDKAPQVVYATNDFLRDPVFDSKNNQLLLSHYNFSSSIQRIPNPRLTDGQDKESNPSAGVYIESSRRNWSPVLDETNKRMFFISDRSGRAQIWVKNTDGQEKKMTQFEDSLYPYRMAYSSTLNALAFDANDNGLYLLHVESGEVEVLFDDGIPRHNPNWLGEELYFSQRSDADWDLYKMDYGTRTITALNFNDGFSLQFLPGDNNLVYFSKYHARGFWLYEHKDETQIIKSGSQGPYNQWQVFESGIYFLNSGASGLNISFYDFDSKETQLVKQLNSRELVGFTLSADEKFLYFTDTINFEGDVWSSDVQ